MWLHVLSYVRLRFSVGLVRNGGWQSWHPMVMAAFERVRVTIELVARSVEHMRHECGIPDWPEKIVPRCARTAALLQALPFFLGDSSQDLIDLHVGGIKYWLSLFLDGLPVLWNMENMPPSDACNMLGRVAAGRVGFIVHVRTFHVHCTFKFAYHLIKETFNKRGHVVANIQELWERELPQYSASAPSGWKKGGAPNVLNIQLEDAMKYIAVAREAIGFGKLTLKMLPPLNHL